ncbi:hypothetical protein ACFWUU_04225 [Kribbella sp. NPDC058693]|uniref:hypothetical protein n=1 Tax=Kribbella sp. NPDC058693 TaxID=3346602 RepID=UPI00366A43D9
MSDALRLLRIDLRSQLQKLADGRGVWQADLLQLLDGRLGNIASLWSIQTGVNLGTAREVITEHLGELIDRLDPRESREELSVDQKRLRYRYGIKVSFNILPKYPELHTMLLEERRAWLKEHEVRILRTAVDRSRRDLSDAIDKMVEILVEQQRVIDRNVAVEVDPNRLSIDASQSSLSVKVASEAPDEPAAPEPLDNSDSQPKFWRKRRVLAPTVLGVALVLTAAGLKIFNAPDSDGNADAPQVAVEKPNCELGFCVTQNWPTLRGCDPATSVAMVPGKLAFNSVYAKKTPTSDFRVAVANGDGGGSWKLGHLYMLMASTDSTPVTIQDIKQNIATEHLPPPAWVYVPSGDCGSDYSRVFRFDLDNNTFVDRGLVGSPEAGEERPPPSNPLGPSFTVTDREPALVEVDVVSCKENYSWTLDITFTRNSKQETRTIGPYRSMGKAVNTELHEMDPYTGELASEVKRFTSTPSDKC